MSEKPVTVLKVKEDGKIYEITTTFREQHLAELISLDPYSNNRHLPNLQREIAEVVVKEFVKRNYDEVVKLIDMDTVKLIATRDLAGVVASNT